MGPAARWAYDLQMRIRFGVIPDDAEVQACIAACQEESRRNLISGCIAFALAGVIAVAMFVFLPMVKP